MVEIASSPWLEIGVGEQVEDLVRAGAADDAVGVEPEGAADRFAQHARGAFRIIFQMIAATVPEGARSPGARARTASRWPRA